MMVTLMEPEPELVMLADRIDALFLDTAGLVLTGRQVRRLLDASPASCEAALQYLLEVGHLVREEDGQYRPRFSPGPFGISTDSRRLSARQRRAPGGDGRS
jgi:hypothetical protein